MKKFLVNHVLPQTATGRLYVGVFATGAALSIVINGTAIVVGTVLRRF